MINVHVVAAKSISNVVVNKLANPYKIRDCGFFFLSKNSPKLTLEPLLEPFKNKKGI